MSFYVVDFYFGCVGWHEDCAFYLEHPAAIGYALGMVTCTGGGDSSFTLILGESAEGSGCTS